VGTSTSDDAAAYRLSDTVALVSTVDYFTPIVDDPRAFGAIAAANALSDVYAMGAEPLFALNVAGFARDKLPPSTLVEILLGGAEKASEAGICIIGGHTVDDAEPKYGLAVTGIVHPDRIVRNVGARPGDAVFLTKPLGTGVLSTGIKRGLVEQADIDEAIALMATLNKGAALAMLEVGVNAATDVTGFGLLGHLSEMTLGSGVGAMIHSTAVPVLRAAQELARRDVVPRGTRANQEWVDPHVHWDDAVDPVSRVLLCDAQTSGGLLVAVALEHADELADALRRHGVPLVARIGEIVAGSTINVVP
jgi:selenium donor protein